MPEKDTHDRKKRRYSFFVHKECEYFPCHPTEDPEQFNCLFCYCPLYALGKACGGNYRYDEKGRKDCTACTFPHQRHNYDAILGRYTAICEVVKQIDETSRQEKE